MSEHDRPEIATPKGESAPEVMPDPSPEPAEDRSTAPPPGSLPATGPTGEPMSRSPRPRPDEPTLSESRTPVAAAPVEPDVAPEDLTEGLTAAPTDGAAQTPRFTLLEPVDAAPTGEEFENAETVIGPAPESPAAAVLRRPGAEQTGQTGIFIERPVFELGAATPDADELNLPRPDTGWHYVTGHRPRGLRRLLLGRVLPVALLLGVTVWSWQLLRESQGRKSPTKVVTNDEQERGATTTAATTADPVLDEPEPDEDVIDATKIPRVLAAIAENVGSDGSVTNVPLRQAIEAKHVTVINLWATWCEPCKNELPELQRMFAANHWGPAVRFLPLMVNDPIDSRVARRQVASLMPPFKHFLVDRELDVNPKAALIAARVVPEELALPVTLLVDCQRRVRKVYRQALTTPEEFVELAGQIKRLKRELNMPRCNKQIDPEPPAAPELPVAFIAKPSLPRKPEPRSAPSADGPECGDKFCDRKRGESCRCKQDCPCGRDESCRPRDDDYACLADKVDI